MTWWPVLADVVAVGGDGQFHAVDQWDEARNRDRRPPLVARCGVIVWKLYGVGTSDGGTLLMSWPPKVAVANQGYPRMAGVCRACRAAAPVKRPSASWDTVRMAS